MYKIDSELYQLYDFLQALEGSKPDGESYLSAVHNLGKKLLVSTAPAGHPRIQSEIQAITADFEDFSTQVS